jgi:glycosyltransferase involved in cell wall biosynthesis
LKQKVHFAGMLSGDAKWGALYGCEAFVLPSHQENFGIAVVEALACGKPVLISNQVNIWSEISNENAGIIRSDSLAGTYEMLLNYLKLDNNEKDILSLNAITCYRRHFDISQIAKNFIDAIQQGN